MKSATLYSRTSTGAIQTWAIETDGARYRTIYGQLDGAIQEVLLSVNQYLLDKALEVGYLFLIQPVKLCSLS